MNDKNCPVENGSDRVASIPICLRTYSIGVGMVLAFASLLPIGYLGTPPQKYKWVFFAAAGILCLGALCVLTAYLIFRDQFALTIDERGIHERFFTGPRSILWDNIDSIGICQDYKGGEAVAFRYKSGSSGRWFSCGRYDAWLCNSYNIDNNQLLKILNDWKAATPSAQS